MVVSTVTSHGQAPRYLPQQARNETITPSRSIQTESKFRETPGLYAAKTALAATAVASCVLTLANEFGWGSSQNETTSMSGNYSFGNSSLVPYNTGNSASIPSAMQSSSSCIQSLVLGSLGMLVSQNVWPLLSGLFSCLPQATAQAPELSCPSASEATFSYTPGQGPLFFTNTTQVNPSLVPTNAAAEVGIFNDAHDVFLTLLPGESINVGSGDCGFYLTIQGEGCFYTLQQTTSPCSNVAVSEAVQSFSYTNNWSTVPIGTPLVRYFNLVVQSTESSTGAECFYIINLVGFPTYSPPTTTAAPPTTNMTPIIIGGAAGGAVLIGVIIGGVCYLKKRKKIRLGETTLGDPIVTAGNSYADSKSVLPLRGLPSSRDSVMESMTEVQSELLSPRSAQINPTI